MRIYGRDADGKWFCVTNAVQRNPQAALDNAALNNVPNQDIVSEDLDQFYITLLCQNLALIKGESPAYGEYGVSFKDAISQFIFPDNDVQVVVDRFSQYFSALSVSRISDNSATTVVYQVDVILRNGRSMSKEVKKVLRN